MGPDASGRTEAERTVGLVTQQLITQLVCQVCGRACPRGSAGSEHWLDEPHRTEFYLNVVRCPMHWSEWALRNTKAGRTKAMRERMAVALAQPVPAIPAWLDPFPTTNRFN
jgi:NAD-dependent dihydropyrimidine dehydrogenase PreA subunit